MNRWKSNNRIRFLRQTLLKDNKGSAIVMVLVAIAFVSIIGSMIMYSTFYNYKMKVVDRGAKDSFYSADLAMDVIRAGLKKEVSHAFSEAYAETMQNYDSQSDVDKNEMFVGIYKNKLIESLKGSHTGEYSVALLRSFLPAAEQAVNKGDYGAYVESSSGDCEMLSYTDGVRLRDVKLTYTDDKGYVSIIETDFLLAYPNLGLGETYEFPDIDEYCLIANEQLVIGSATYNLGTQGVRTTGSVYGGKNGVTLDSGAMFLVQEIDETENGEVKLITDGEIKLGNDESDNTPMFATSENVDLWTLGIEVNGIKAESTNPSGGTSWWERLLQYIIQSLVPWWPGFDVGETAEIQNLVLMGDSYVQDDITINSSDSKVYIAGTYTGFGNNTTKAKNSSSIIVNGANASIDMSQLKELNLGGNTYIGTSALNVNEIEGVSRKNEDIKMGNAVASKMEQLAYLVPAECIGYDMTNGKTVIGKNPVNVKDKSYMQFMEDAKNNPDAYREVNLNLVDGTVGKPLSNYGATYEKIYFKPDSETVWAYYYLKFASTAEASRFFEEYYKASPEEINKYLGHYIHAFTIGDLNSENMNIAGNMITRTEDGVTSLHPATVGMSTEETSVNTQIELNKKYAECSNQYVSLCKTLVEDYGNLSATERKKDVYENLINTEMIDAYRTTYFNKPYVAFKHKTGDNVDAVALLILGDGRAINIDDAISYAEQAGVLSNSEKNQIGLIVSERSLEVSSGFEFKGTIISKGDVTVNGNNASFSVTDRMQDILTGSYTYSVGGEEQELKALSLFRAGKDSEIADDESTDKDAITADKLVVYENWTKQ